MIVLTAQMWPKGNQAESYELLNATITNQGDDQNGDNYFAHLISRPNPYLGIVGVESDVEIRAHKREQGCAPLIISVLAAAHVDDTAHGFFIPPSRALSRSIIADLNEFDQRLKGRS